MEAADQAPREEGMTPDELYLLNLLVRRMATVTEDQKARTACFTVLRAAKDAPRIAGPMPPPNTVTANRVLWRDLRP